MLTLRLFDNDYKGSSLKLRRESDKSEGEVDFSALSDSEKSAVRNALSEISGISLSALEAKGAVIFPSKSVKSDLNGADKIILSVQNLESENPTIKTTNIMGFFAVGDFLHVEIRSRFERSDAQFFLHYMLQKACNAAPTVELTRTGKNPLRSFAVYLFPAFLKRALEQGLFRTYVRHEYNDSALRGPIDFPRHFKKNVPFTGKIAYRTREASRDNPLAHLVRHTIEYIGERGGMGNLLSSVRGEVNEIRTCTERYKKSERNLVIAKNEKPISSPFYSEYENLRKLCRMILLSEQNSYTNAQNQKINGIIFDGAALWEEYLNVALQNQIRKNHLPFFLEHPNNRTGAGRNYLFKNPDERKAVAIYPDFLLHEDDAKGEVRAVLDAKYKNLSGGSVPREDYFQVLTYMFRFKCKRGILIYPYRADENEQDLQADSRLFLAGHDEAICFEVLGLGIPQGATSYMEFSEKIGEAENKKLRTCLATLVR